MLFKNAFPYHFPHTLTSSDARKGWDFAGITPSTEELRKYHIHFGRRSNTESTLLIPLLMPQDDESIKG